MVCFEMKSGAFDVKLEQSKRTKLFKVTYGKQVRDKMGYGPACAELGGAIMHVLSCEGKVDKNGPRY